MSLPTAVESFKTLDDLHCVKLSRVNQILIVGDPSMTECKDGITPPFANAKERLFKPEPKYSKEDVSRVEEALLSIFEGKHPIDDFEGHRFAGWAPSGWKFIDTEEQCVLEGNKLVWKPA